MIIVIHGSCSLVLWLLESLGFDAEAFVAVVYLPSPAVLPPVKRGILISSVEPQIYGGQNPFVGMVPYRVSNTEPSLMLLQPVVILLV